MAAEVEHITDELQRMKKVDTGDLSGHLSASDSTLTPAEEEVEARKKKKAAEAPRKESAERAKLDDARQIELGSTSIAAVEVRIQGFRIGPLSSTLLNLSRFSSV